MPTIFNSKDSVFFVGGRGTKAGDADAGGGCTLESWNDPVKLNKDMSKVMGPNGEPRGEDTGCNVVEGPASVVRILGNFGEPYSGVVANIEFTAVYANGRYEILDSGDYEGEPGEDYYIDIDLAYISDTTCDIWCGGAFDTAQAAWNNTDATNGHSVIIHSNKNQSKTNGDFTATWNLGTAGGSLVNKSFKRFAGFTTQLEDGGQITFDGEDDAAFNPNGGIRFDDAIDNVIFKNVIVEDAYSNWKNENVSIRGVRLINCEGNSGALIGFYLRYGRLTLIGCKADGNGLQGFDVYYTYGANLIKCIASNNGREGFANVGGYTGGSCIGCLAYGNGNGGTKYSGFKTTTTIGHSMMKNCVAYDNGKHGFEFAKINPVAINCIAKDNGQWGFYADTGGDLTAPHVAYCCAHGNGSGQFSLPAALPEQNCIEEDPQFVDAANGDFRPRNPAVLRGGKPDINGNPTQMGAILQKYQFGDRERIANMARLRIIR